MRIPFSRLATILDEAEEAENSSRGKTGQNAPVIQVKKWKKRKRTPTPQPGEEVYNADAEAVERRQMVLDGDYTEADERGAGQRGGLARRPSRRRRVEGN